MTLYVDDVDAFAKRAGLRRSHRIEMGVVCLSLFLIGPGKYSLDEKVARHR